MSVFTRLQRFVRIERHEWETWWLGFVQLFLVLCGYYMIRPIRETLGTEVGADKFQWLFTATFLVMLCVNPVFGALASRWSRRRLVPAVYGLFVVTLLVFAGLFYSPARSMIWLATVFYVWVSVFNYIAVSLFWSVMADLFSVEQGKRLFGALAAGGTLGALLGPMLADRLISHIGTAGILASAAGIFLLVTLCSVRLTRLESGAAHSAEPAKSTSGSLGGSPWAGMAQTFASPYLLAIGFYMLLGSALGSLIYTEQARIVAAEIPFSERTQFFARADFAVNTVALFLELIVAGPLFSHIGLYLPLVALPVIGLAGIPLLSISPSAMTVAALLVVRRATEYAIAKPAREVLFTVVTREQKYKSKNFIDTVLARGGDAVGAWIPAAMAALVSQPGIRPPSILYASLLISLTFAGVGWWLAGEQRQRARGTNRQNPVTAA